MRVGYTVVPLHGRNMISGAAGGRSIWKWCGGGNRSDEASLEDRFEGLDLHGEEEKELDLSREVEGRLEETRWIGIFRVHTQKPLSHVALFKSMCNAWATPQGITFKMMNDNLFLVQFMCPGD